MSYSFNIRAATKAQAKVEVAAKMAETAAAQKCHARDLPQAVSAAHAFIDTLSDDDGKDVQVSMSGYLTGEWTGSDVTRINGASISVSAGWVDRAPAA